VTLPVWHCSGALAESALRVPKQRYDVKRNNQMGYETFLRLMPSTSPGPGGVAERTHLATIFI